ncbi:MAG: hypothetical protein LBU69_06045, partial [Deltaproteobacteria bacterium]|jgi:hypothetical protein|nr:hypothetical protein [Deltaproteobacteria bacterium]
LVPLLFCAGTFPIRLWGVFKGHELGYKVYTVYRVCHCERIISLAQWAWLAMLSFLTALAAVGVFSQAGDPSRMSVPWAMLSILALWLYRKVCFGRDKLFRHLLYPVLIAIFLYLTIIFV